MVRTHGIRRENIHAPRRNDRAGRHHMGDPDVMPLGHSRLHPGFLAAGLLGQPRTAYMRNPDVVLLGQPRLAHLRNPDVVLLGHRPAADPGAPGTALPGNLDVGHADAGRPADLGNAHAPRLSDLAVRSPVIRRSPATRAPQELSRVLATTNSRRNLAAVRRAGTIVRRAGTVVRRTGTVVREVGTVIGEVGTVIREVGTVILRAVGVEAGRLYVRFVSAVAAHAALTLRGGGLISGRASRLRVFAVCLGVR